MTSVLCVSTGKASVCEWVLTLNIFFTVCCGQSGLKVKDTNATSALLLISVFTD